jgi:amino acid adenylation domain-containing protein
MKNILEYLETTANRLPQKIAFCYEENNITFYDLQQSSKRIGSGLIRYNLNNKPIVLLFDQGIEQIITMLGIVYSGNFYVVLDSKMPRDRLNSIINTLETNVLIYSDSLKDIACNLNVSNKENYNDLINININQYELDNIRNKQIDTDIVYAIFTSGSTGTPKGTVVSHNALFKYIEWFSNTFDFNENIAYAGQMQFYFSASVSSLFSCLKNGFSYYIVPKSCFIFPINLVKFLNEKKIDTIYWVPSALGIMANYDVFKYEKPLYLKTILFVGEVMPVKYLNYYIKYLGNITYANLFGPTETVDICTYYIVDRSFNLDESIPIGKPCNNCDSFILNSKNERDTKGELCVRGSFLASGYYNMLDKTREVFVQNPLNTKYPELIYKTGDLVELNEKGEYIYIGRVDNQIKHMGYRIELGEIDKAGMACDYIRSCITVYDKTVDNIIFIFEGKGKKEEVFEVLKSKVPNYMIPQKIIKVNNIIYNANGKIDRKYYSANYKELER